MQQMIGNIFFYAKANDLAVLMALSTANTWKTPSKISLFLYVNMALPLSTVTSWFGRGNKKLPACPYHTQHTWQTSSREPFTPPTAWVPLRSGYTHSNARVMQARVWLRAHHTVRINKSQNKRVNNLVLLLVLCFWLITLSAIRNGGQHGFHHC